MARLPVSPFAGLPHHAIQRGNNRQPIFVDRADHEAARPAGRQRHALRRRGACLRADGQPLPPAGHARQRHRVAAAHAVGRAQLRALLQRPPWPQRHVVGRALQVDPDPDRALPADLHGLHRPQPGARGAGDRSARLRVVQPCALRGLRHDRLLTPHPLYWELGNTRSRARRRMSNWCARASGPPTSRR